MSVLAAAITVWPVAAGTPTIADWQPLARSWPERVATAGDAVWFYLGKLAWPHPLIAIYPRWRIDASQWFSYLPLLAAVVVLFALWCKRDQWARPWFFAYAYFLSALVPFLTLIEQTFWRYSFVEDHLQYLASIGPLALAGAGLARLADVLIPGKLWLQSSLCAGLVILLGVMSWNRAWAYESEETLWTDTLAKNPNCWIGYNNLGLALFQRGKIDDAIAHFQKALEINPNFATAHNNLGSALGQKGQVDEAMIQFQRAFALDPAYGNAHYNLGYAFFQKGRFDEAIAQYQKALSLEPFTDPKINYNLGVALFQKGRLHEAQIQFQQALQLKPDYLEAQNYLAKVKALLQQQRAATPK
jgi:tetratricopeptide (TPR) repeat protein